MSTIEDIATAVCGDLFGSRGPEFKGETFDPKRDGKRLGAQLQRVIDCVVTGPARGQWFTLSGVAGFTESPEASVSARLRDLRRMGYTVERRYIERGLWQYKVSGAGAARSGGRPVTPENQPGSKPGAPAIDEAITEA